MDCQPRPDVLLTVPHGADDKLSAETGRVVYDGLVDDGISSVLLVNKVSRRPLDMNRRPARDAEFRRTFASAILMRPRFVLDVHSYPMDVYEDYMGPAFAGKDVVLLHVDGVTNLRFLRRYATIMTVAAALMGRRLKVAVGSSKTLPRDPNGQTPDADILRQARELGMPDDRLVLAEHNYAADPLLTGEAHRRAITALGREQGWFQ